MVRAGLAALLRQDGDDRIIVTGMSSGFSAASREDADVILNDADDEGGASAEVEAISTPVVLLTSEPPLQAIARGGIRAVLPHSADAAEVIAAIHAAANGLIALPAEAWDTARVPGRGLPQRASTADELSSRELEVLRSVAEGRSNKIVAWRLGISEHTVKFHISSIFAKLHVSSRTEAVAAGVRLGLILL